MPRLSALLPTLATLALFSIAVLPPELPAHQDAPVYNRISLSESAHAEVDNDLLVAVLYAQAEGHDSASPADAVNRAIDWAINAARSLEGVKVQTLGYSTHPVYGKSSIRSWRVQQSLRLESRDSRKLGDLIGELQSQLKVQSLGYEVSAEERRRHLDTLTAEALQRFTERAGQVAKTLGRDTYRIVRININDGQQRPAPVMRGMMMESGADMAAAPARVEAGTRQMTVSVSGEIELQ